MSSSKDEKPTDAAADGTAAAKKKKKLVLIGAAAAVVLLGGGGGAFMMMGGEAKAKTEEGAGHDAPAAEDNGETAEGEGAEPAKPLDVPPLIVNLRSPDGAPRFLKVHFILMPGKGVTSEALEAQLPRLLDAFQPFLRELRPEDLSGSAALFRIKEELLVRARETIGAGKVQDVLIQDLIQQ